MEKEKMLTMVEAAKRMGVHKATVRRWAKAGKMKGAFRLGDFGHWRIRESDLDKLMAGRQAAGESGQGTASSQ